MKRVRRYVSGIAGVIILAFLLSSMEQQSFFKSIASVADTNPKPWGETIMVSGFTYSGSAATLYWDAPSSEQPFGTISDYNLFLFGDHKQENADSEGPVFVLGNATYNSTKWTCGDVNANVGYTYYTDLNYRHGTFNGVYAPTFVLGGDLRVVQLGVDNGSFLHDAGSDISGTSIQCSGGGQVYEVASGEIAAFAASAKTSIDNQMSELRTKSQKSFSSGTIALGEDTKVAGTNTHIIELDAGTGGRSFNISLTGFDVTTDNLIINVIGDASQLFNGYMSMTIDATRIDTSYTALSEYAPYILWNLAGHTGTINSNANVCGSVIAPDAEIKATGNINGNVVANSLDAGAGYECHSMFFRYNTGASAPEPSPSASPSTSPSVSPSVSPSASPGSQPSAFPGTTPSALQDAEPSDSPSDSSKAKSIVTPKMFFPNGAYAITTFDPDGFKVQPGDKYVLYEDEKLFQMIDTLIVNEDGQLVLTNLTVGMTYYVAAPDGTIYKINYTGLDTQIENISSRKFAVIPKTGEESIFSKSVQLIKSIWNSIIHSH